MYTMLSEDDGSTAGRVATLLLAWRSIGEQSAHFLILRAPSEEGRWVVVSTHDPRHLSEGAVYPNATAPSAIVKAGIAPREAGAQTFIYPEDVHANRDPDVCAKISQLYVGLPVGCSHTARLGPPPARSLGWSKESHPGSAHRAHSRPVLDGKVVSQRVTSVSNVAVGRQASRIGALGLVPSPAETCSHEAPWRERPLARAVSRSQLVTSAP